MAPEKHRLLIGRGGETRRQLESQFNIGLDIPKLSQQGPSRSQVKVSGNPADIEKALVHIKSLVAEQEGETLPVPRKYHHAVSDNGSLFRRLRNDHRVTVEHGGQQPPRKPTTGAQPQMNGGASMPLITDDPESVDNHHWQVVDCESPEEGDIPWILRGLPDNVQRARSIIDKAIEQAKTQETQAMGYLVVPDPRMHRFVIGPGGSQINFIRSQTGCKITVPREADPGSAIEIMGSQGGVEHAKELVLEAIQNGGNRGRRE